jgi:hypothetical protein
VAVLHNPANPAGGLQLKETQDAARTLGVKIQTIDVRDLRELEIALAVMVKPRVDVSLHWRIPCFSVSRSGFQNSQQRVARRQSLREERMLTLEG